MDPLSLANMDALDLYAVVVLAIFNGVWMPVILWRVYQSDKWLFPQKLIFVAAAFGLWIAPAIMVATSIFNA